MRSSILFVCLAFLASTVSSFTCSRNSYTRPSTFLHMGGPEIDVISQPGEKFLEIRGVFKWGTWGCGVSKFPWTYDQTESCYLLSGKVTVTPTDGRPAVTVGKGDFITFPAGMSCTWDVTEPIQKHFKFY